MNPRLSELLKERKLVKFKADRKLILKEMKGASYDLEKARRSLNEGDAKWAIVQGYYAMFHAARALLYRKNLRERSHRALLTALRELYRNSMGAGHFDALGQGMDLREEADYSMTYSEEGAKELMANAQSFLTEARRILGIPN